MRGNKGVDRKKGHARWAVDKHVVHASAVFFQSFQTLIEHFAESRPAVRFISKLNVNES